MSLPIFGFILLMIFRSMANIIRLRLLKRGLGARRVVLIGNCDLTHVLADFIENNPLTGFKISGIVARAEFIPIELKKLRRSSLESALTRDKIDVIIQTDSKKVGEHYQLAQKHYLDFYQSPELDGIMTAKHTIDIIDSVPLIHAHPTPLMGYGQIVKRIINIVDGTIGIIRILAYKSRLKRFQDANPAMVRPISIESNPKRTCLWSDTTTP